MATVNIYDVAKAAGVHRSTVSRALTGSAPVSPEKKKVILEVAKRLNYFGNSVAGALKSKRRSTWGFLSFWVSTPNSSDTFYAKSLGGLLDTVNHIGYRVLMQNVIGRFDESEDCLRFIHDAQLGGLVILAPRASADGLQALRQLAVPAVVLAGRPADPLLNCVDLDNVEAGRQLTAHLASLGRKRIAFLGGERELNTNAQDRFQGYLSALKAAGLRPRGELIHHGHFNHVEAEAVAERLLALPAARRPDAAFCATDMMAAAFVRAARRLGLKVPRQLAVAGLDDNPDARVEGGLTTVPFPFFEAAKLAGDCLVKLSEEPGSAPIRILIPPRLIIRGSSVESASVPA